MKLNLKRYDGHINDYERFKGKSGFDKVTTSSLRDFGYPDDE